jgi:hypothetical protein
MIFGFAEKRIDPRQSRNWSVDSSFYDFTRTEQYAGADAPDYIGPMEVTTVESIFSQLQKAVVKGFAPGVEQQYLDWSKPEEDLSGRDFQHIHKVVILVALLQAHTLIEQSDWNFGLAFMEWQRAIRRLFSSGVALQLKPAEFNEVVMDAATARIKRLLETGQTDKFTKIVEAPNGSKRGYLLVSKLANANRWYKHGVDVKKAIALMEGCGAIAYLVESKVDAQGKETLVTNEAWITVV